MPARAAAPAAGNRALVISMNRAPLVIKFRPIWKRITFQLRQQPVPATRKGEPGAPWNPRPPGPAAGPLSYPGTKIQAQNATPAKASASHQPL